MVAARGVWMILCDPLYLASPCMMLLALFLSQLGTAWEPELYRLLMEEDRA